jgi:hypothetical protein
VEILNFAVVFIGCVAAIRVILGIIGRRAEVNDGVPAGTFLVIRLVPWGRTGKRLIRARIILVRSALLG